MASLRRREHRLGLAACPRRFPRSALIGHEEPEGVGPTRYRRVAGAAVVLAVLHLAFSGQRAIAQDATSEAIRARVQALAASPSVRIGAATVRRSGPLVQLYSGRNFAPLWTRDAGADLVRAIRAAYGDGLNPDDYHLTAIDNLGGTVDPSRVADLDVLRSDALLLLLNDLRFSKLDPDDPSAGRRLRAAEITAAELARIARSGRIVEELDALRPRNYIYRGMTAALAELREIERTGGWGTIPSGPTLRAGDRGQRVAALRRRLEAEPGHATLSPGDPDSFDHSVDQAVRAFQHRHGVNEDGLVGPVTLAELNVPVAARIRQLRINLERARWITRELPTTFVAVNIAGAKVYYIREGSVVWESRAIVGQTSTRTPMFQALMRQIDLNPTWTVPPGIVGEVLADIRREPGYMARVGMKVIDAQGRTVNLGAGEVARYSAGTFPYVFRQDAGPLNPLGQVKFLFPNPHNVYLHDTPSRTLFEREQRTFSHGCIRLQNPLDLAVLILDDAERWSRNDLLEQIAVGRTRTITLPRPIPVLVLYWTASTDLHGELHFYRDVYGRDDVVLQGLDG